MEHEGRVPFYILLIDVYDREYRSKTHYLQLLLIFDTTSAKTRHILMNRCNLNA